MANNSCKWTHQEEQLLKRLRQEQKPEGYVQWKKIALKINEFSKKNWTAKQCREKYVNYVKFGTGNQINIDWSIEQLQLLKNMYDQHGSSWSLFSSLLPNRSQNSLKNKFNNSIRKTQKLLCCYQSKLFKKTKRAITFKNLIVIFEFTNQLKKLISKRKYTVNRQSTLFSLREKLLNLSFPNKENTQIKKLQIQELIQQIKTVNSRLRCFGVFKAKKHKQWKLQSNYLGKILQFDDVILQKDQFVKQKPQVLVKIQQEKQVKVQQGDQKNMIVKEEQENMQLIEYMQIYPPADAMALYYGFNHHEVPLKVQQEWFNFLKMSRMDEKALSFQGEKQL